MSESVREFTTENWESEVVRSKEAVLVDFWAQWCGPCRLFAPVLEGIAPEFAGRVKFGKLNVDEHPELAARYRIFSIPTLLLFRNGEVAEQRVGALPAEELRSFLGRHAPEALAS